MKKIYPAFLALGSGDTSGQRLQKEFYPVKFRKVWLGAMTCLIGMFSYYSGFSHYALSHFIFADQLPYGGIAREIPGLVEAEEYDEGGLGVAYHDVDATNNGKAYRTTEAVDVGPSTDIGGGFNLGWVAAGEWLEYTVNVKPGTYNVNFRVASADGGRVDVKLDGVLLGTMSFAPHGWL